MPFNYSANATGRPADPDLTKDTVRYHDLPITPQFPFGHGLSYSEFRYSDLSQNTKAVGPGERIDISITVENIGGVASDEVVQLYVRDPVASVARPVLELRGFKRVELGRRRAQARHVQPHARTVRILEPARAMAHRSGPHRLLDRCVFGGFARQWLFRDHENSHRVRRRRRRCQPASSFLTIDEGELHAFLVSHGYGVVAGGARWPCVPHRRLVKIEEATIDRWDPAMDAIVPKDWKIEKLAEGFGWAEGPIWVKSGGYLLFTDVPGNKMWKWSENGGLEKFLDPSGAAQPRPERLARGGRQWPCDPRREDTSCSRTPAIAGSRSSTSQTKKKTPVATLFEGKKFSSPNDVTRMKIGVLFFTDPPYGFKKFDDAPEKEIAFNGVYRMGERRQGHGHREGTVSPEWRRALAR